MTVKGLIPIPYWRQPEQREDMVKIVPLTDQLQYYATRSEEASRNAYVSCKRQEGLDRKMEAVVNELHEIKQEVNRTNELMERQTKSLQSLEKFMERQVAYARPKMRLQEATLEVYESVIDEFQSSLAEEDGTMEGGN